MKDPLNVDSVYFTNFVYKAVVATAYNIQQGYLRYMNYIFKSFPQHRAHKVQESLQLVLIVGPKLTINCINVASTICQLENPKQYNKEGEINIAIERKERSR